MRPAVLISGYFLTPHSRRRIGCRRSRHSAEVTMLNRPSLRNRLRNFAGVFPNVATNRARALPLKSLYRWLSRGTPKNTVQCACTVVTCGNCTMDLAAQRCNANRIPANYQWFPLFTGNTPTHPIPFIIRANICHRKAVHLRFSVGHTERS